MSPTRLLRRYWIVAVVIVLDLLITGALFLSGMSLNGTVWVSAIAGVLVGVAIAARSNDSQ